jgi:hypothetical protein
LSLMFVGEDLATTGGYQSPEAGYQTTPLW